jgi:hypothetical protein
MPPKKLLDIPSPRTPVDFGYAEVAAIQALAKGCASEDQQKIALQWIIERAGEFYEVHHYPNGLDIAFANGRRFVGREIVNLINLPPTATEALRKALPK